MPAREKQVYTNSIIGGRLSDFVLHYMNCPDSLTERCLDAPRIAADGFSACLRSKVRNLFRKSYHCGLIYLFGLCDLTISRCPIGAMRAQRYKEMAKRARGKAVHFLVQISPKYKKRNKYECYLGRKPQKNQVSAQYNIVFNYCLYLCNSNLGHKQESTTSCLLDNQTD